jgi:hypothetical protein
MTEYDSELVAGGDFSTAGGRLNVSIAAWNGPLDCCLDMRGNIDGSSGDGVDISDLIYLVNYTFGDGPAPTCFEEADVNADGTLDISDLIWMVNYTFGDGPAPLSCR